MNNRAADLRLGSSSNGGKAESGRVPRSGSGAPPYSSKIIKAGALLPDTKALLAAWDSSLSIDENLLRVRQRNLLGKTSRSRLEDILSIFRQRYLAEESTALALATLVERNSNGKTLDQILYFYSTRANRLLYDVVIKILMPQWSRGVSAIEVQEIDRMLAEWVDEGKTSGHWNEFTIRRVTQGVLSTLRDFGVLQGAVKKRIAPGYLMIQAFSFIAFVLKQEQPSGNKLLDLTDWQLFFLSRDGVERFFLEAHQHGLLEYHVAGSVTRLTFPAATLVEYASVIAQ